GGDPGRPAGGKDPPDPHAKHSEDFTSVDWFGTNYCFTRRQAGCVKVLWAAWENGTAALYQTTILDRAGSAMADNEKPRLAKLLRGHPAWGKMIVPNPKVRGAFQLAEPPEKS